MSIEIPNLSNSYVRRLYCAVYVQNPDDDLVGWIGHVGQRHAADVGNGLWLRDFYFSSGQASENQVAFAILTLETEVPDADFGPHVSRELLDERFSKFIGRDVTIRIMIGAKTPRDRMPKKGKIDALLGVGTDAGGIRMELTGAKLRVQGSVFDGFRWELTEIDEGGTAMAVVESQWEGWLLNTKASWDVLTKCASLGSKAIDYFLLDKAASEAIMSPKGETEP
jgi:hypothetical protein